MYSLALGRCTSEILNARLNIRFLRDGTSDRRSSLVIPRLVILEDRCYRHTRDSDDPLPSLPSACPVMLLALARSLALCLCLFLSLPRTCHVCRVTLERPSFTSCQRPIGPRNRQPFIDETISSPELYQSGNPSFWSGYRGATTGVPSPLADRPDSSVSRVRWDPRDRKSREVCPLRRIPYTCAHESENHESRANRPIGPSTIRFADTREKIFGRYMENVYT